MDTSRQSLQFFQVDVFTSEPFGGNPLAVFPSVGELSDREFQQVAREMNLADRSQGCCQGQDFYSFP
jgi:trans-2,3-dihydro-3-hydroxyanthranilate isomerase